MQLVFRTVAGAAASIVVFSAVSNADAALFSGSLPDAIEQQTEQANYLEINNDKLYKKCRRKVRRELGAPRKSGSPYRFAFIQQCVYNGGAHW